ncbi:MAG: FG-GAP-like repeat-containing protein, partial [Planctomycetota bacterium]
MRTLAGLVPSFFVVVLGAPLSAQWVTFQDQTSTRLVAAAGLGASDAQEKDYAWGDFDQDGDTDLVVVRKQPATSPGHFPNVLFMNEAGVLTDRTTQYASAALVAGSQGMLDATNDRDVVVADVTGDGWLDIVTCTTLTAGNPQYIRVPRVYVNRGSTLGVWQGFLYDDPLRINDMQPGSSWNGEHRFCAVAAGDVDNDGDLDLFFGDYDRGTVTIDVNDRLLLNNGAGYFTDVTAARLGTLSASNFVSRAALVDINLDGRLDIVRNNVSVIDVTYNNGAAGPGYFQTRQTAYTGASYHFGIGDLNNDSLPDLISSDDGQDRYTLHGGVSGGVAQWLPTTALTYSGGGGDDGFAGNSLIVDLNNDGWNDALVADFDVDVTGCSRRCHIFRNLGNLPNPTLQEQMSGGAVCGIPTAMLSGTFDVAVFDINGDGWKDIVLGRCNGTTVWINQPPIGITFGYPNGLPAFVAPGPGPVLDVNATGIGLTVPQTGSGRLHWSVNGAAFQTAVMQDLAPGQFRASFPVTTQCADSLRFYVTVDSTTGTTYRDPPAAPATTYSLYAAAGMQTLYESGFEAPVTGWTVGNDASLTGGAWEIAVPNFTIFNGQLAAPPFDAENLATAVKCWVTQNGPAGGTAAATDVDGGPTDLISPPLDFAGSDGFVSYRRWFYSSTAEDTLEVAVSGDGVNWAVVETVAATGNNTWQQRQFRVGDHTAPTGAVRVRFRTSDNPNNSTVEAGIDVFKAEAFTCSPCQQVIPLATNGNAWLSVCGGNLSAGTVVTLKAVSMPGFGGGLLLFDLPLTPTPWAGGTLLTPAPVVVGPIAANAAGTFAALLPLGGIL